MRGTWSDCKVAVRQLVRRPVHTAAVLLSMALGVGLDTAAFGFFDLLSWEPVPGVEQPGRAAALAGRGTGTAAWMPLSYPDSRDLAAGIHDLSGLAARLDLQVQLGSDGQTVLAEAVDGSFFAVLGVRAQLGRMLSPADEAASDPQVAVLSDRLWSSLFGRDRRVLGQRLLIDRRPFTILGVAAPAFQGVDALQAPLLWVPLRAMRATLPDPAVLERRDMRGFYLVGRLAPGASFAAVEAAASAIEARLTREHAPDGPGAISVVPLSTRVQSPRAAPLRRMSVLVLLAAAVFLGIACCNVVDLLLIRALARRHEVLTRLALGVSRARLLQQFLVEGLVLALLGGAAGLGVAAAVQRLFVLLDPPFLPGLAAEPLVRGRGALFALLLTLSLGLLCSVAPYLQVHRGGGHGQLCGRDGSGDGAGGRFVGGHALLAVQAGLSTAAVASAGLFLASLLRLVTLDPGFERQNLLLAPIDLHAAGYTESAGRRAQHDLLAALSGEAAVAAAALSENRPLGGYAMWRGASRTAGSRAAADRLLAASETVSRDYFRTVGIPLLAGRAFDRNDTARAPAAAIVDETLARRLWPRGGALGGHLYLDDEASPVVVVGVARDIQSMRIGEPPLPVVYLAVDQRYAPRFFLDVRPAHGLPAARAALVALLGRQPAGARQGPVQPIGQVIAGALWLPRTSAILLTLLGGFALLIAAIGMAGAASYIARQRVRELAIRAALGARRRQVLRAGAGREVAAAVGGVIAGAGGALLVHRWAAALLCISGRDLVATLGVAAGTTLAVTLVTVAFPAAVIASTEPIQWLRS